MNIQKRTKQKAFSQIGKKCKDYEVGCPICESYKYLELMGKFPDTFEILCQFMDEQVAKDIMRGEYK